MIYPYSEEKFIELFKNQNAGNNETDPDSVIKTHQALFDFMQVLPGTFCFIFDFCNLKYLLVSKSVHKVVGISAETMLANSFYELLVYFHPDDRNNIGFIHKEMFSYLYSQPVSEFKKLRFDFNYRILVNNKYVQILQQTIFTVISDGKPLYDFSTCIDVTQQKRNQRMELNVFKLNDNKIFELVHEYVVPGTIGFGLSPKEFKVLKMASEGLTSKDIADQSFKSLHTINNQRRSILAKTKSASIAEAMLKMEL